MTAGPRRRFAAAMARVLALFLAIAAWVLIIEFARWVIG